MSRRLAWFVALVSAFVLVGWRIESRPIVQLYPTWAPMQMTTAACFLLLACAALVVKKTTTAARALAVVVGAFCSLTLFEYGFGVTLGIDTIGGASFVTTATSHPGRMAPNTALAFVCASVGLWIYSQPFWSSVASTLAGAFGAASLVGYASNLVLVYQWSGSTSMAFHTSILFVALSLALVLQTWSHAERREWIAVPVFAGLATTAVAVGQGLSELGHSFQNAALGALLVGSALAAWGIHGQVRSSIMALAKDALAVIDPATGLLNREGLSRALELLRARNGSRWSLFLRWMNRDELVRVIGAPAVEAEMRSAAKRFADALRDGDHVGSIPRGLVGLFVGSAAEAHVLERRAKATVEGQPIHHEGKTLRIKCDTGLAPVPASHSLTFAIHDAEQRMGRGNDESVSSMLRDPDNYAAAAQPIVDLRTGEIEGYEMLARFKLDPFKRPDVLFAAAAEEGMSTVVDELCLQACLAAAHGLDGYISVNLYPSTLVALSEPELRRLVAGFEGRLVFEVSEKQMIDHDGLAHGVELARACDVEIALDDFGAYKTYMEILFDLQPERVKIDRCRIDGVAKSASMRRTLKALAYMCEGTLVVAEGIEREEDAEVCRQLGIRYGQGWHYGRPELREQNTG